MQQLQMLPADSMTIRFGEVIMVATTTPRMKQTVILPRQDL